MAGDGTRVSEEFAGGGVRTQTASATTAVAAAVSGTTQVNHRRQRGSASAAEDRVASAVRTSVASSI